MGDNKVITVSGFAFDNPKIGEEALKEQEAVEYVSKQLNFDDTKSLLALYNQMVSRRMFHTQVGISYLKSIQDYLLRSDVDPATIEAIPINDEDLLVDDGDSKGSRNKGKNDAGSKGSASDDLKAKTREKKLIAKNSRLTKVSVAFIVISIVLLLTVVGMFIIANTSDNPTILNYEEVLQNKYASWEQDLERREEDLQRKENYYKSLSSNR